MIHKIILAPLPELGGGAGGPPAGGCGDMDGVDDIRISFLGTCVLRNLNLLVNLCAREPELEGEEILDIIRALFHGPWKYFAPRFMAFRRRIEEYQHLAQPPAGV
jgi:hypothetical protein